MQAGWDPRLPPSSSQIDRDMGGRGVGLGRPWQDPVKGEWVGEWKAQQAAAGGGGGGNRARARWAQPHLSVRL